MEVWGENTLEVNDLLLQKLVCNKHFGRTQISIESKLILIQRLDEKDWIKSMYIECIIYIFLTTIRPHVCDL